MKNYYCLSQSDYVERESKSLTFSCVVQLLASSGPFRGKIYVPGRYVSVRVNKFLSV